MNIEPSDWNVVILGAWNRAILTPSGIAQRIFQIPVDTPVEMQVSLEGKPTRVLHEDIAVTVAADALHFNPQASTYDLLHRAMSLAHRALESLPETPVKAAGFNIRYRIIDPTAEFLQVLSTELDDRLSEADLSISCRGLDRSLVFEDGVVNLSIRNVEGTPNCFSFESNFHRASGRKDELQAWLSTEIAQVQRMVQRIAAAMPGVEIGDES